MVEYMKWENRGVILASGVWEKGDVSSTQYVEEAKALGASL